MPRIARAIVPGVPHHVTQRGNFQQDVLLTDEDHEQYLAWLAAYAIRYGARFCAWCLMSNDVHFAGATSHLPAMPAKFPPVILD